MLKHQRKYRWLIFTPAALLALTTPAQAQNYITWTCNNGQTTWLMQQPIADYQAGLYPRWADCLNWQNGTPENYVWSYGPSVTTTTTEPATTTTEEPSTTTTEPATTTTEEPATTTTEPATTTTEQTTTTTTTVYTPPETTTTTTTTEPPTTTTTTEPPTTTSSSTTTTHTPTPQTTLAPTTTSTTTPQTTNPTTTNPPETTSPPQNTTDPTPQQIVAAIENLNAEQAAEVFAELDITTLTDEEQAALIEAVQAAPQEIREAFEEQVDIFKEGLDDYIPIGSTIPVGQRRTIVAIGAAITAAGASTRMRR